MDKEMELPEGWECIIIKDIGKVETGSTPSKAESQYYGNDFPFFKPTDLSQGINTKLANDNLSPLGFSKTRKLPKHSILVTCIGATIGKAGLTKIEGASNQQINAIIPNSKHNPKFVFFQVTSQHFQNEIKNNASSTTLPLLNKSKFEQLPFLTVDITIQNKIVEKIEELFSELDKGIENLKTAQQQLKVYRQAVLKWAFEGKLTNSNIKDGELPEGWEWNRLGDVVSKKTAKVLPSVAPDLRFIGMDCIAPHSLKPHFTYSFSEFKSAGNYFEENQVLYGRMRPYLNKVYRAEYSGACSGEFIVLECKPNFMADLLKYILHSREFVEFANHKTAGDRPRISFDEITDYPIALCPIEEQYKIVQEIESRLSVCDKIEETITTSLQQAEALRQSILKKAFEGKLVKSSKFELETS